MRSGGGRPSRKGEVVKDEHEAGSPSPPARERAAAGSGEQAPSSVGEGRGLEEPPSLGTAPEPTLDPSWMEEPPPAGWPDGELDESPPEPRPAVDHRPRDDVAARPRPEASSPLSTRPRVVVFGLGGKRYAAPTEVVRSIWEACDVTPLPNLPSWLVGVVELGGEITSVIDLQTFCGERRGDPPTRFLVVASARDEMTAALAVDWVEGIVTLTAADTSPATDAAAGTDPQGSFPASVHKGLYQVGGHVASLVDLGELLDLPEVRDL